jgi:hypothetical protein
MKNPLKRGDVLSRREVLQTLALLGAAPVVISAAPVFAQQGQSQDGKEGQGEDAQGDEGKGNAEPPPPQSEEPEISDEARRIGELARARYGDRLDAEQFEGLVEDINYNVRGAERMRKIRLANADEPDFVFRA